MCRIASWAPTREYGMPIRVVSQLAWHNLFARQLFIRPDPEKTGDHVPQFSIFFAPDFQANPAEDGTNSETCIVINFKKTGGPDLRHQLRRRNEEIGLHDSELPAAGARRVPDALLGEHGRGGRRGAVLRTLGDGQDDAFGGCRSGG